MQQNYKIIGLISELRNRGFRYNYLYQYYTYEFPVYKYKRKPLIVCRIIVHEDNKKVDYVVIDNNNDNTYASYYNQYFGNNRIIKDIDKCIQKEFKKLGIKKVGDIK